MQRDPEPLLSLASLAEEDYFSNIWISCEEKLGRNWLWSSNCQEM